MAQSNIWKLQASGHTHELARVIGNDIEKSPCSSMVETILKKAHLTIVRIANDGNTNSHLRTLWYIMGRFGVSLKAWSAIREYIDLACDDFVDVDDTTAKSDHANNGKKTWSNNGNYHRMYDGVAYNRVTRAVMHDMHRLRKNDAYYDVMEAVTVAALAVSHGQIVVKEVAVICDLVVKYRLSFNALTEIVQYIARFKPSQ